MPTRIWEGGPPPGGLPRPYWISPPVSARMESQAARGRMHPEKRSQRAENGQLLYNHHEAHHGKQHQGGLTCWSVNVCPSR